LGRGLAIPAHPLALTPHRKLDERRQRALTRYYQAAGAGGLAVGVHTTQFAIRDPRHGLLRPVLELAAETARANPPVGAEPLVLVAGVCGHTAQAVRESGLARELGYHVGLLGLGAMRDATEDELIDHARAVARELPLMGFYLQPAAGGRELPFSFWRRFAAIEEVMAIKIAPFDRYRTLDVIRAVAEADREDVALYTGNDDSILVDLLTPFRFRVGRRTVERRIVGGLLGHWAVWTRRAVDLHRDCRRAAQSGRSIPPEVLRLAAAVTDANGAFFDAAHAYAGCIAGLHEVLRRQGLLRGTWCLDRREGLSPGQAAEIDRVCRAYPELNDDAFVREHLATWLNG
jgi:dihydrodipicolinate synthase/N-acetylneuraminate lyase